jgi:hypothetical protein
MIPENMKPQKAQETYLPNITPQSFSFAQFCASSRPLNFWIYDEPRGV